MPKEPIHYIPMGADSTVCDLPRDDAKWFTACGPSTTCRPCRDWLSEHAGNEFWRKLYAEEAGYQ